MNENVHSFEGNEDAEIGLQIKPLQFESCQFVLNRQGIILAYDPQVSDKLGIPPTDPGGHQLRSLLIELNPRWEDELPDDLGQDDSPLFLLWEHENNPFSIGLSLNRLICGEHIFVTLSPDLAPQEMLQQASLTDFHPHSEIVAQLFLRLQLSESRLNNYMQNFPGFFFCQRPDLSFTFIAPKFERALGVDSLQHFYKNGGAFLEHIYPKDRAFFLQELDKHSRRAKTFSLSYRMRRKKNGGILYFMDVRTPLYSPTGLLLGYEGVWLDISRQSIAENRLTSTSWRENLSTITSGLVHDFSNIMAGIHSLSELYHDSLTPEDSMYKGMEQIKKNSMQAQKLVRRIIDLNREQSGQRDYYNLENLIRDQSDLIRIILPKHSQVQTELTGEELAVYIDEVAFRQMLLNMAMNARDAFEPEKPGAVTIRVLRHNRGDTALRGTLAGDFQTDKEAAEVIFEDNGCGISEAHLHKIFAPFFTTKEAMKGSGFGLYNAKLFIENNRGRISVKSTPGEGTAFHILLPLADFTEMENEQQEQENDPLFSYNKRRPAFAVYASKDPSGFELVTRMRAREWEVITFDTFAKLKRYLKESEYLPHAILAIDLGHDPDIRTLLEYLSREYPGIKTALQVLGRNPDEHADISEQADVVVTEAQMSQEILSHLQELIS